MYESKIEDFGPLRFPDFGGKRVMMMPFLMEQPRASLPDSLDTWRDAVAHVCSLARVKTGVGYLTIDEALVLKGETHRRPGLHVDGRGAYGAGPAPYAANGMFLAASHVGCAGYPGTFDGEPGLDGDCEHLRWRMPQSFAMSAGRVYWCSPFAVHEALTMHRDTRRQLLRVSMPSNAHHHRDYTPNPTGVKPAGEAAPARFAQMDFRR